MICHYEKELVHSDHIFNFGSKNDLGDFCVKKKLQWSVNKPAKGVVRRFQ